MTETPDLTFYKIAVAKNGGPVAFMLKENVYLFGKKDDTKNFIFIFSSYGKLITTVDLAQKIPEVKERKGMHWIAFEFTDEEDLFILSNFGELYFIDPKTGKIRDQKIQLNYTDLVDSRYDHATNLLVFRNSACEFFYLKNIAASAASPIVKKFATSATLESYRDKDESLISDYIAIPAGGSGKFELLVADPYAGFHLLGADGT